MQNIEFKNVSIHNIKGENIIIPKEKLIVVTGVSGSGKSSMIFDVLHNTGQKFYLEALGMYQDNGTQDHFDMVSGLVPTIAVRQRTAENKNPRSVVGTVTKIFNLLAVLFVYEGIPDSDFNYRNKNCLRPGMFLFNSPHGSCPECMGRGVIKEYDIDRIFPSEEESIETWHDFAYHYPNKKSENKSYITNRLDQFVSYFGCSYDTPVSQLSPEAKQAFLYYYPPDLSRKNRKSVELFYFGIRDILKGRLAKLSKDLSDIETETVCPNCKGDRLNSDARKLKLHNKHMGELGNMTILELENFVYSFMESVDLSDFSKNIAAEILKKINCMKVVGLSYLTLYRQLPTLSGGETQRLFIMGHLSSRIESVAYIFDEPTAGLHEAEKDLLITSFKKLREQGNTVIVVEHDETVINSAEHIIDFGPKAGIHGGTIVYQGDREHFLECEESITAKYLKEKELPQKGYSGFSYGLAAKIRIEDANINNLRGVSVEIPLHAVIGICGVSGSGKSTLIVDALIPMLNKAFRIKEHIQGVDSLCVVDQKLTSRSDCSCVATYLAVWERVREIFASESEARQKGYDAGSFSFNSTGSCTACGGTGYMRGWMSGLYYSEICSVCGGERFKSDVLQILYKGKSIADILNMTVSEGLEFFHGEKKIVNLFLTLEELGMGYILLGQRLTTLSGGEAQRLKLARELGKKTKSQCLYILDEPTVGLSCYDTKKLLELMFKLVKKGHSIVVIEHDPYVLSLCDYLIEMGYEGGDKGGLVIAEGTVTEIIHNPNSRIKDYLQKEYYV